jgi:glycosyltransferase involved in cell wall biosynthesis
MKLAVAQEHCLYFNGGIRYLYEVTSRLAKWCNVSLIVQDISDENEKMFSKADVEILSMDETTANKLKYWIFYPYYLVKHSLILRRAQREYKFDVWISSSPTTHIMCMLAGIKPILCVFELNPWLYLKSHQQGLTKGKQFIVRCGSIVAKLLEKMAYKNASKIIVYSKYIQSEVKRVYGVDSEVVYTGVDSEFFKPTHNPEIEDKYKGHQVILHVASYLSPMKGTDLAIEAMGEVNKKFPDAVLVIITSSFTKERFGELLSKSLYYHASVDIVTNVKDKDMPAYYTMASCLLSPSLDFNVHLPVLEASCCETPSVSLEGDMETEDIVNAKTGYFVKGIDNLADCIKILIVDKLKLRSGFYFPIGQNARKFVMERFNWDKCVENYKKIIGETVK